ncbi:pregnancy zone protein [Pimephales promelas]|nr:pregnancy zone protein [Pimephales promelas]
MAPAVQILVYSVLPSENVVAASVPFDTDMYFQNQVSLQFSPATAVPAEGNVLTVSAQAGSLRGRSERPDHGARKTLSVRPCVRASVRPCVRPCVRPSVRASVRPCVRPSVRACVRVRASVRPCVRPCVRPSVRHKDLGAAEWSSHGVKSPNTSLPSLRWKKFVLPKFDVTVYAPQTYSVAVMGLKVESCAKCTYGQSVPGQALVEVCRDPFPYSLLHNLIRQCLTQTAKMNTTGCASLTVDVSVFLKTKFEDQMQDTFLVNVTEEGTDKSSFLTPRQYADYAQPETYQPYHPVRPPSLPYPHVEPTYRGPIPTIPHFCSEDPREFARLKIETFCSKFSSASTKYSII